MWEESVSGLGGRVVGDLQMEREAVVRIREIKSLKIVDYS